MNSDLDMTTGSAAPADSVVAKAHGKPLRPSKPAVAIIRDPRTNEGYLVAEGGYKLEWFVNPSGNQVVRVNGTSPTQGRIRENFESLAEADARRKGLICADNNCQRPMHMVQTELTADQLRDAEAAYRKIQKLPAPNWEAETWTLVDAVIFVGKNYKPCRNPHLLGDAIEQFLLAKEKSKRRPMTLRSLREKLTRLSSLLPGAFVPEVQESHIEQIVLKTDSHETQKGIKNTLSAAFKWFMKKPRWWASCNPTSDVDICDAIRDDTMPVISRNSDVQRLLTRAQTFKGGRLFLNLVLKYTCALRPAETGRLEACRRVLGKECFKFGPEPSDNTIEILGKTRQARHVEIPGEVVPLVKAYVEAGYPFLPANFDHDWSVLRANEGFAGSKDELRSTGIDVTKLEPFVPDCPRHTGITHRWNHIGNEHLVAHWAGNTPAIILSHYKGRATSSETEEFYAMLKTLRIPSVEELKQAGIAAGASNAELEKLGCPVDNPMTYFMEQKEFDAARQRFMIEHPDAEPLKDVTRRIVAGKVFSKSRQLVLPPREELIRLVWTTRIQDLAKTYGVTRGTMAGRLHELDIPMPPMGSWNKRAAGIGFEIPPEVAAQFPDGLPPYRADVGRPLRDAWPTPHELLFLLWHEPIATVVANTESSMRTLQRHCDKVGIPRPERGWWHRKTGRVIPKQVKLLLKMSPEEFTEAIKTIPRRGV